MAKPSVKHLAFVDEYFLQNFNGTEAYMRVYKPKSRATARANAAKLLAKTSISEEIKARLAEKTMSADEVLTRLTEQARADFGTFIVIENEYGWRFDMEKLKTNGHLVKSISTSKSGVRIELYDAQAALRDIGKHHGLFTDRVEHTGEIAQVGMTLDEWKQRQQERRTQVAQTLAQFDEEQEETDEA